MRSMGWYREIVVVIRKFKQLAQIKFGVVAQTGAGISGGMFTLGDAEFAAVEPIRLLTGSVRDVHKDPAFIVFFGQSD